jgi:phosphopantetheinyl transferase
VRFRELTLRLYQEGFRVFVQVGSGTSLTGFIDDTLKDKPHLAISANVKQRSGLAQLRRLMAAIYCEGGRLSLEALQTRKTPELKPLRLDVPLVRLPAQPHPPSTLDGIAAATGRSASASASASASPASSPVIARFSESLRQLARSQEEVMEAFARAASAPRSNPNPNPNPSEQHRHLSIESHPYLIDHCFYRQPANWPEIQDRYPVVPMTLMLDWLRDLAGEPGRVSVLEDVRALRWLAVAPPTDVTLRAHPIDASKKAVSIEGFSQAVAMIDRPPDAWSMAPPLSEPLVAPPIGVDAIYRDRWMFHGPGYQGIRALHAWSRDGVDGELQTPSAPGGLLDNAGQLLGLWVMMHTDVDRMAFPVRLERVEFFSDPPREGERVRCAVRIRELTERAVRADLWLSFSDGRPYCRITGWEDRRFDSDARLWEVLLWPERNLLAVPRSRGYLLVTDAWRNLPSRDLLARRYLNRREREQFESLVPRRQGPWLNGRIAVKDAVRNLLWQRGHGALFPAEIEVHNDSAGRPWVRGPFGDSISVSLAHTAGGAVARVAEGRSLGIDLERIEPRPEGFINLVLSNLERSLLPEGDAWLARVWTAKEAVAKLRGTGLGGDPKKLPLQAVEGERVLIDGIWVETTYDAPFIIAWSEQP